MPIPSLPKVDKYGVLAIHTTPQNRLGECFFDNQTNEMWVYVRANAALAQGAPVAVVPNQTITSGLLAAAAGSRKLNFGSSVNLDTTFPRVPNQPRNADYMIVKAPGNQVGTVYEHRQREMSVEWWYEDDFQLATALAADDDLSFITPWLVTTADGNAGNRGVVGFAQKAIAVGNYFWALVQGLGVGLAGAAISAGDPLSVVDAGDGLGPAQAADTANACAYALEAAADTDLVVMTAAAPGRTSIPQFKGGRSKQSYQHPSAS